jgi:hypothetical protein
MGTRGDNQSMRLSSGACDVNKPNADRIDQLRLEIENIQALNQKYRRSLFRSPFASEANEKRRLRLMEIMQELANMARPQGPKKPESHVA